MDNLVETTLPEVGTAVDIEGADASDAEFGEPVARPEPEDARAGRNDAFEVGLDGADDGAADGREASDAAPDQTREADGLLVRPDDGLVRVKFNKQRRAYTPGEAAPYVEMGLKWESFKPAHEKLRYLAEAAGVPVDSMIDRLVSASERHLFERALEETGGNAGAARQLAGYQAAEARRRFETAQAAGETAAKEMENQERAELVSRLADGFIELQREAPGRFATFADVPPETVALAAEKGISLYDAWLRREWRVQAQTRREERDRERRAQADEMAAAAARGAAEAAAIRSAGSLSGFDGGHENAVAVAFARAFRAE